ncbi:MAG: hypothetical protein WC710_14780 [Gallionella sp.]|jgi:hypothetical protein
MAENASSPLADLVEGRDISDSFTITLTPRTASLLGDTIAAEQIGRGLIRESLLLLKTACEADGFVVVINGRMLVY